MDPCETCDLRSQLQELLTRHDLWPYVSQSPRHVSCRELNLQHYCHTQLTINKCVCVYVCVWQSCSEWFISQEQLAASTNYTCGGGSTVAPFLSPTPAERDDRRSELPIIAVPSDNTVLSKLFTPHPDAQGYPSASGEGSQGFNTPAIWSHLHNYEMNWAADGAQFSSSAGH